MTWQYCECEVILKHQLEVQLAERLTDGWELVGLHRKQRRGRSVVMAIMRRPNRSETRQLARA